MGSFQKTAAVNYLLGKLDEREQKAVEEEFFNKPETFDDLLMAESELYDSYVLNRLSKDDRDRFERRLLITAKQRERKGFADALVKYVSKGPDPEPFPDSASPGWVRALKDLLSFRYLLSYGFATAVVLLLGVAVLWWALVDRQSVPDDNIARSSSPIEPSLTVQDDNSLTPVANSTDEEPSSSDQNPRRQTATQKKPAGAPNAVKRTEGSIATLISTIVLSTGAVRSGGVGSVFVVPKASTQINLQLEFEDGDHASYFAVVETAEGQQVWRGKVRYKGGVASVRIPSSRIRTGDYIVSLKGLTPTKTYDTVADYSFTIERK